MAVLSVASRTANKCGTNKSTDRYEYSTRIQRALVARGCSLYEVRAATENSGNASYCCDWNGGIVSLCSVHLGRDSRHFFTSETKQTLVRLSSAYYPGISCSQTGCHLWVLLYKLLNLFQYSNPYRTRQDVFEVEPNMPKTSSDITTFPSGRGELDRCVSAARAPQSAWSTSGARSNLGGWLGLASAPESRRSTCFVSSGSYFTRSGGYHLYYYCMLHHLTACAVILALVPPLRCEYSTSSEWGEQRLVLRSPRVWCYYCTKPVYSYRQYNSSTVRVL